VTLSFFKSAAAIPMVALELPRTAPQLLRRQCAARAAQRCAAALAGALLAAHLLPLRPASEAFSTARSSAPQQRVPRPSGCSGEPVPSPSRRLLGGAAGVVLLGGAAGIGAPRRADAAVTLDLGKLSLIWQKLAEGRNPLEVLAPGARRRLRSISKDFDALQEDVFAQDFNNVLKYQPVMRKFEPLFTEYTDSIFPGDTPMSQSSRVAMRYEVGKLFSSLDRLNSAAKAKDLEAMQKAFADMSLAFDRYVKAGDLYAGADPIVSTEMFYRDLPPAKPKPQPPTTPTTPTLPTKPTSPTAPAAPKASTPQAPTPTPPPPPSPPSPPSPPRPAQIAGLRYIDPAEAPPMIKDKVILLMGPDKGRTGLMIGRELANKDGKQIVVNAFVKFDGGIGEGADKLKEIKLVPYDYIAKQEK